MDKTAKNRQTLLSKTVGSCIPQKSFKNVIYQNRTDIEKETRKEGNVSQTTIKKNVQRVQNGRTKEAGKTVRSQEEISESATLEAVHVQRVYDQIAPHIQDLKQKTWPRVKDFLASLEPGSLVADVGCGNGRYLQINPSAFKIGSDICLPFLNSASLKGFEVLSADNLQLPYRDDLFDAAISIGVIHHFCTKERRLQALRELTRIVRPGGLVMVYVWAFEQKYRKFDSQDILVPWHKPKTSESSRRRPRLSSLSDSDRLSTSSTGSSLSDEEITPCPACQLQDMKTDSHSNGRLNANSRTDTQLNAASGMNGQLNPLESLPAGKHDWPEVKEQQIQGTSTSNGTFRLSFANKGSHSSGEKFRCRGSVSGRCHVEQQLAKGEALIRECQKVESYITSLSQEPWETLLPKNKSSENMRKLRSSDNTPRQTSSPGSFEEPGMLDSLDGSSLNGDDVFISEEYTQQDSTEAVSHESVQVEMNGNETSLASAAQSFTQDKPEKAGICLLKTAQSSISATLKKIWPFSVAASKEKQKYVQSADDISAISSPEQGQNGLNKNDFDSLSLAHDPPNVNLCEIERDLHDRRESNHQKQNGKSVYCSRVSGEFWDSQQEKVQDTEHAGNLEDADHQCTFEDDLSIVDLSFDEKAPQTPSLANPDLSEDSPKNVLYMIKDGLKSIFTKSKQENGKHLAPYFVPCISQSFPPEHFQIREFPQSSLPADEATENAFLDDVACNSKVLSSFSSAETEVSNNTITSYQSHVTYQDASVRKSAGDILQPAANAHLHLTRNCDTQLAVVGGTKKNAARKSKGLEEASYASNHNETFSSIVCEKDDAINTDLCRFYHVFREGELVSLVAQNIRGVEIVDSFYDHANWCLILKKV
ncbi:uncharacterized protein [Littorina saxatilis]|uniref:uncharacterized protein n=1 Tax=Littorina saxatilis TaxID=31220 RepID=UPI0038B65EEB